VQVIEILIVGIVFMALFGTIYSTFTVPTGNTVPYDATTTIILKIVPLLVVIGLLYYVWSSSQKHKGGMKI